ncbi:hypothetical protein KCU83_g634, partial [Aureobasidium melanogenum]
MPLTSSNRSSLTHEDTIEALAALLTQYYTLQLLLPSHSTAQISQPPHTPSPALLSQWQNAGMSGLVIETLKQLPFLSGEGSKEVAPDTRALDYLNTESEALDVWKDPFCLSEEAKEKVEGYLGNAIPLTSCIGRDGWLLLLDLDTNNIYEIRDKDLQEAPTQPPPKGAPKYYYKHFPHKPALSALKEWIEKTKKLDWVPDPETGIWLQKHEDELEKTGRYDALKQLYFDCGWPERFDQEAFLARYMLLSRSRGWDD